jgi:hypothetical protein
MVALGKQLGQEALTLADPLDFDRDRVECLGQLNGIGLCATTDVPEGLCETLWLVGQQASAGEQTLVPEIAFV